MIRILLACAGGMSTSLLMNKMKAAASDKGIELEINARGEGSVEGLIGTFDILLLGPQVKYVKKKFDDMLDVPVMVINMRDYGTMNGAKVLDDALEVLGIK